MATMNAAGAPSKKQSLSRNVLSLLLAAGLILLIPFVAMQFTKEVVWTAIDFLAAGALLVGFGLLYVLSARMLNTPRARTIVGVGLAVAFALIWMELAVGIFGTRFAGS